MEINVEICGVVVRDDDPEAIQQIENGEFATEGCLISEDSPKWECGDCKIQFGKINLNF